MSQDPNAQPQEASGWSKTKSGFSTVGKGASSARTGINSGLSKLDSMSISSKGVSFKKQLSAGNVRYDRDNHVSAPKMDVSHMPPPPRRVPGQVNSPRPAPAPAPAKRPNATAAPVLTARPQAPSPGARQTPPIPSAPRPGSAFRSVPVPPRAVAGSRVNDSEESLPLYTPVSSTTVVPGSTMDRLTAQVGSMRASPAPIAPKPTAAKPSSVPSMTEASSAFSSAKTMGGLYGKYGNQKPGQKTATPSWAEIKAGASAAQNLHSFHGKYAPKESNESVPAVAPTPVAAPKPVKPVPFASTIRAAMPSPAPKPPLPRNKPTLGPPKEYCVGLYSFEAQAPGDLSFNVGERIEVLERTDDPDAWWRGKLHGQEGIFPANYCRMETA